MIKVILMQIKSFFLTLKCKIKLFQLQNYQNIIGRFIYPNLGGYDRIEQDHQIIEVTAFAAFKQKKQIESLIKNFKNLCCRLQYDRALEDGLKLYEKLCLKYDLICCWLKKEDRYILKNKF